jgi:glycerophosphoryl diester phosphodiesterase
MISFELQGHRGARGVYPENTLPSFEYALDCGVVSIEVDLQLTQDHQVVIYHDGEIGSSICRSESKEGKSFLSTNPRISESPFHLIRSLIADLNPDPKRFPDQSATFSPLATKFTQDRGFHPYAIPTLKDFFDFVEVYVHKGSSVGKSEEQCSKARRLIFDLEIKHTPFGQSDPISLIEKVIADVGEHRLWSRSRVRSFDHWIVKEFRRREARMETGILIAGTSPTQVIPLLRAADAGIYCPDYRFLRRGQVEELHRANYRVIPWTVNDPNHWKILQDWGVDGITTDFPDRLK